MRKALFSLFLLFALSGCLEREIYTEIADKSLISHPPERLRIEDPSGLLKSTFKTDPSAPISLNVYIHSAHCTNAQSRSLGTDFDGYVRITISDSNRTLARSQMDYKGEPSAEMIQTLYTTLIQKLQWNDQK